MSFFDTEILESQKKITNPVPVIPEEVENQAWLPKENLPKFDEKISKIAKKAAKLGVAGVGYKILAEGDYETEIHYSVGQHTRTKIETRRFVHVEVYGEVVKLPGWNLKAVIEHNRTEIDGEVVYANIIRTVPEMGEVDPKHRFADTYCDHCKTTRYRTETFILIHDDGSEVRVGRSCLKDFLGHVNPKHIMNLAKWLKQLEEIFEDFRGGSRWVPYTDSVQEVLELTASAIRKYGWVSRSAAEKMDYAKAPTSTEVSHHLMISKGRRPLFKGETFIPLEITDADKTLAAEALAWIKENDIKDPNINDYIYNCLVAINDDVTSSRLGLVCSIVGSYVRKLEKDAEVKYEKKESNWYGQVKDRVDLELEFQKKWVFDSQWGTTAICKFVDEDGNVFIWKTSNFHIEPGTKCKVRGTIKAHDEKYDVKQTVLTRCKLEEI